MSLPGLLRRHASNHVRSICKSLCYVESSLQYCHPLGADFRQEETNRLSSYPLAQYFGIFVDKEIPDGIIVAFARCGLRERPASDFRFPCEHFYLRTYALNHIPFPINDWPAWRSIVL